MASGNPYGVLESSEPVGNIKIQLVEGEINYPETESIGFLGLKRDTRVKLLPEGFPPESLPRSSSSLFTIANRRGLFAAAGPKSFVIGSTASLREAFFKDGDYTPQLTMPSPISLSHIAFNADESHLILGAAQGGLAVYSIDALAGGGGGGGAKATFEVGTDGQELREVKPNPTLPETVAIVTMKGDVRILDLNTRSFKTTQDGNTVLKEGVVTIAWSKQGKQLICGMDNGTAYQMTPKGEGTAELPAPPDAGNHYVSSILWIENNLFIIKYTPLQDGELPYNSEEEPIVHFLERSKGLFSFKRIAVPSPPCVWRRLPQYYFTAQLQQYAPALKNAIIFAGTCSPDVGVVLRMQVKTRDMDADTFETITIMDDTRQAHLPLSRATGEDTSPIGMALDLSSKENVKRPVGGEEIEESPGPLPILMLLNHEGSLSAWHVVYEEAIRKGEKYNGMVMYDTQQVPAQKPPQTAAPTQQNASPFASAPKATFGQSSFAANLTSNPFAAAPAAGSTFGQPSLGNNSTFGSSAPAASSFGQPALSANSGSTFSQALPFTKSQWGTAQQPPSAPKSMVTTAASAFGQTSVLGANSPAQAFGSKPSPWSTAQPPSTSKFSAPTAMAFGQTSALGANSSAPAFGKPTFGQASALGPPSPATPFGKSAALGSAPQTGAFANFANKGGFAAVAQASNAPAGGSPFGSGGAIIARSNAESAFGGASAALPTTPIIGAGGFKLGSVFKAQATPSADDGKSGKPDNGGSLGGFGSALGGALGGGSSSNTPATAPRKLFDSASPRNTPSEPSPFANAPVANVGQASPSPFAGTGAPNPAAMNPLASTAGSGSAASSFTNVGGFKPASANPFEPKPASTGSAGINPFARSIVSDSDDASGEVSDDSPQPESDVEAARLPPDFTAPSKTPAPELPPALPPALPEDDDSGGADDEGEEEVSEEEETEEIEDGEGDEVEGEEEEDVEVGKENEVPKTPVREEPKKVGEKPSTATPKTPVREEPKVDEKPSTPKTSVPFGVTPSATTATAPDSGSIFSNSGSFRPFSSTNYSKDAPFSSFFAEKQEEIQSEDDDDDEGESEEEALPPSRQPRGKMSLQSKGIKGMGNLGHKATKLSRPAHTMPLPSVIASLLNGTIPKEEDEEDEESVVDFDAEYSDHEDEKIREQLCNGPLKPSVTIPEIKKLAKFNVSDFNTAFDDILISGNMMVNKLGQMARGLQCYHLAQQTPVEGVKHEKPEDMKPTDDWRLCELAIVSNAIADLESEVQQITSEAPKLEEMRRRATKGFIKLNTKESEVKRLFSVHNDPTAAARARARLLAPEQQIQQRNLRKAFSRLENSLKEAEYKATLFKAKLAARDRHRAHAKYQPPTVEGVRTTILKLTAMAEKKSRDVEYLEEKLRRMRQAGKVSSSSSTPRHSSITPERELETPIRRMAYGVAAPTPVMALVEEGDLEEVAEDRRRRKQAGKKLGGVLRRVGGRITDV